MSESTPMSKVIAKAKKRGILTDEEAALLGELDGLTVADIPLVKFDLEEMLDEMLELPNSFDVASRLLDFMREAELIGLPSATPVAPAQSFQVELTQSTRREEMGLSDLFEELAAHLDDEETDELIQLIHRLPIVQDANTKLHGSGEYAIQNKDGSFNFEETKAYIRHLAGMYTQPQRKWKEHWPTTLERALGRDQRIMIYPFTSTPLVGPDPYGNDWTKLSDLVHEAMIAAVKNRKLALTTETDIRRVSHELFGDELPQYLQDFVEEYERDKERGQKVERYATPEQLRAAGLSADAGSRHPFGGELKPKRDEAWYREQLYDHAQASIRAGSSGVRKQNCILTSVSCGSGSASLTNVIVLEGVSTGSGRLNGTFYMPPNQSPSTGSGGGNATVYNRSWQKLYELAVKWGIISDDDTSGGSTTTFNHFGTGDIVRNKTVYNW